MIAHLQGKLVETPTHVIIDCGGRVSREHLLTYLFFASKWRFYKIHSPSNKEDAHTLFGFIEKSEEIF
jgi:Holliday junction resolvasome RuvABC DNA-binding subunit